MPTGCDCGWDKAKIENSAAKQFYFSDFEEVCHFLAVFLLGGFELFGKVALSVAVQLRAVLVFAEGAGNGIIVEYKPPENTHLAENLKIQQQDEQQGGCFFVHGCKDKGLFSK